MARKTLNELEMDMLRLKEREQKLKEELALQRKAAEARAVKERNRKLYTIGSVAVELAGEDVLDAPDLFRSFLLNYQYELLNALKKRYSSDEQKLPELDSGTLMFGDEDSHMGFSV